MAWKLKDFGGRFSSQPQFLHLLNEDGLVDLHDLYQPFPTLPISNSVLSVGAQSRHPARGSFLLSSHVPGSLTLPDRFHPSFKGHSQSHLKRGLTVSEFGENRRLVGLILN